jgi:hypothetical protein
MLAVSFRLMRQREVPSPRCLHMTAGVANAPEVAFLVNQLFRALLAADLAINRHSPRRHRRRLRQAPRLQRQSAILETCPPPARPLSYLPVRLE